MKQELNSPTPIIFPTAHYINISDATAVAQLRIRFKHPGNNQRQHYVGMHVGTHQPDIEVHGEGLAEWEVVLLVLDEVLEDLVGGLEDGDGREEDW